MNNKTLRLITLLSIVSILGVLVSQAYWIKNALETQDAAFNLRVGIALKTVAREILLYNKNPSLLADPVVRVSRFDYVVKVNDRIEPQLLEGLLKKEFLFAGIKDDFHFRVYDCFGKTILYEKLVSKKAQASPKIAYLNYPYDNYFFYIKFPYKRQIWDNVYLWLFSSLVVMVVIFFLGYLLYAVFKQKMLSQIQRDFVNNMTHEFKTPLTSISLASEILKDNSIVFNGQKILNYVTIINKEAAKLESQVERILQMSYADREEIKLKKESVEVHKIILRLVEKFEQLNKNIFFELHLLATNNIITADMLHFSNILDNLIDNAIKYSPNNPGIRIKTFNTRDRLCISIKDNGVGIDTEHQKKIFNNFYRISEGDKQNIKGFGLGLYYVKLLTKAHGAEVKVESQLGMGAEFIISFPL